MIRIALCDDEQKILDETSIQIRKYAEEKKTDILETACFSSAKALLSALEDDASFDIFFLDIYIGDEMGTELARVIRKRGIESPIIFLTTSVEHAPSSFEFGTLRYLIKPLDVKKLYEALEVAINQFEKQKEHLIKLKTDSGIESLNASRILYSEAQDHYQYVVLNDGRQIKVRMTVSDLYNVLKKQYGFIRVGSAYIINLRNIKTVTTKEVLIYNGFKIPIPRGKSAEIKNAFWEYQWDRRED